MGQETQHSISAFFPAYNDGGTIASMVISVDRVLRSITRDYEIIVVNDGSVDYTQEMLDELREKYPALRAILHPQNAGYGRALRSGFANASKDLVFYTDGDAQYDPRELVLLLEHLTDDVDVVNGYKIQRHDPLHRIIIGRVYHWIVKIAFGLKLQDVDCDFRLLRKRVLDSLQLESDSGVICVELMTKIQQGGFVVAQVPVHHYHRAYGKSQFFAFRRIWHVVVGLVRLWWKLILRQELSQARRRSRSLEIEDG
ncbi:MAG: glycosyltransferase family 2 protein [Chloroflexi bacterium]|nr:glycosyltransferase family 2 protein [Chloroflexota bacterium]MCL5074476.1 glycosyltransferase family 2 protein [Chloroflexota bacterium]